MKIPWNLLHKETESFITKCKVWNHNKMTQVKNEKNKKTPTIFQASKLGKMPIALACCLKEAPGNALVKGSAS